MNDFSDKPEPATVYSYKSKIGHKHAIDFFSTDGTISSGLLAEPDFSFIEMGDPACAHRLRQGFYAIENHSFRWMGREAEVLLDIPESATQLFMRGYCPEGLLSSGPCILSIVVENEPLHEASYTQSGSFLHRIAIPHLERPQRLVAVRIIASRTFVPAMVDNESADYRELSVTVEQIGFGSDIVARRKRKNEMQPYHPYFKGTCIVCGEENLFVLNTLHLTREAMVCNGCGSSNRIRQLGRGLLKFFRSRGFQAQTIGGLASDLSQYDIAVYDTDSRYSISKLLRSTKQYVTSDYLPDKELGALLGDRHYCQDLSKLTFSDDMFDLVVTSDVFEHVRLYREALREIFRVLKPGGVYVFTVPFDGSVDDHHKFVDVVDPADSKKDIFVREAVYHGDPLQSSGSLLFRIYGKTLFKELEQVGFIVNYERSTHPHLGIFDCDLFYCIKPEAMHVDGLVAPSATRRNQGAAIGNAARKPYHMECRWLNIELSSICNLRCRWCVLDHRKPKQFLTLETLEEILQQIAVGDLPDLERIDLHNGGESLLHPHIDEALQLFATYRPRFEKSVFVSLLTNGTVLKESTLALLTSGKSVDEIRFSMDGGTVKDFEYLRKNAKWSVVSRNLRRVAERIKDSGSRTKVGIICIVPPNRSADTGWMEPEFREMLALAHETEIRHPHTWEGMLETSDFAHADPAKKRKDKICKFLKNNMVVLASGKVTVCCADLNSRGVVGNLADQKLAGIVAGANRTTMIELWQQGRFDEIPICSTCEGYPDAEEEHHARQEPCREHAHHEGHEDRLTASIPSQQTIDPVLNDVARLVDERNFEEAVRRATEGFQYFKDAAKLHFCLYEVLNSVDRRQEAEWHFALAQSCDPSLPEIHNEFGVRAFQSGNMKLSVEHCERAVRLNPAYVVARKNLADLYVQQGRGADAIRQLRTVLELVPNDVETLTALGHISRAMNAPEDALFFFERVLLVNPDDEATQRTIHELKSQGVERQSDRAGMTFLSGADESEGVRAARERKHNGRMQNDDVEIA